MACDDMDRERLTQFERHAQSVVALILTLLLAWIGITVQKMDVSMEGMKVKIEALSQHPVDIDGLVQIETRLSVVEYRLHDLENHLNSE